MAKKLKQLHTWLVEKQEIAIEKQDYTREMVLREVIRKVNELHQ